MVLGFKVTTLDGKTPTIEKALIRNISKIHGALLLLDFLLGLVTPGDPYQKYTDRIAGTRVVKMGAPMQMLSPTSSSAPPTAPLVASTMNCPNCGKPISPDYKVCPYCGTPMKMLCPSCGKEIEPEYKVCPYCGTKIK